MRSLYINYVMKHVGCVTNFKTERGKALYKAFVEEMGECKGLTINELCIRVSTKPSPRFWVSEERAAVVVSRIFKGDLLIEMSKQKREMFFEIAEKVGDVLKHHKGMSINEACIKVVNGKASRFHLTPMTIKVLIGNYRRKKKLKIED